MPPIQDGVASSALTFSMDIPGHSRKRGGRYNSRNGNGSSKYKYSTGSELARGRGNARGARGGSAPNNRNKISNNHLTEISISKNSIHASWKKELGPLIRYKVAIDAKNNNNNHDPKRVEREIDEIYYGSGCNVTETKALLLESLGVSREIQNDLVEVQMAVELDGLDVQSLPIVVVDRNHRANGHELEPDVNVNTNTNNVHQQSKDEKGIHLHKTNRPGEGPAHSHEEWTTVLIPSWAIGRSYYFELTNRSELNLSCEMFLDGVQIARNVPVPAGEGRTVRPDNGRYFQSHKWVLTGAIREKLQATASAGGGSTGSGNGLGNVRSHGNSHGNSKSNGNVGGTTRRNTPRYNGIRPDYQGLRKPVEAYPDPTSFGWKFTGSVEKSRVEFFEKETNMGKVKLDWYYTTGTVKTVLDHPSTGRNQLFRSQVSGIQFVEILKNPRVHTNVGYRRKENRPAGDVSDSDMNVEGHNGVDDEFDHLPSAGHPVKEEGFAVEGGAMEMEDANMSVGASTFYAKNDEYDFKTQGHCNRRQEMEKMHHNMAYTKWQEAATKEYAVIHAKFYISLPQRTHATPPGHRMRNTSNTHGKRHSKERELEPLPEQAKVIDIKAAEKATLGTEFMAIGPPKYSRRSAVRMERINGLKDAPEWRGLPLYEKKLYYRAEDVVGGQQRLGGDELDDDDESEGVSPFENEGDNNMSDDYFQQYKSERINQAKQHYQDFMMRCTDPDGGEERWRCWMNKIANSDNASDVDESLKMLFAELTKNEFGNGHPNAAGSDDMEC